MERSSTDIRIDELAGRTDRFETDVEGRFDKVDRKFDRFEDKVDARFDKVDARFEQVDKRFDKLESKVDATNRTIWASIFVAAIVKILFG
jgi:tetrahydromethanopterin S-methyltransferase subunit G